MRKECVLVAGRSIGCGFAVSPGWILTCAHVLNPDIKINDSVEVRLWDGVLRTSILRHLERDLDLALLEDFKVKSVNAVFGNRPRRDALVLGIGFPVRDHRPEFDEFTARVEGFTTIKYAKKEVDLELIKLKQGRIECGFSGGPLINMGTGEIVGVTRFSNDTQTDLGGWAITPESVSFFCFKVGVELNKKEGFTNDFEGGFFKPQTVERVRDLLLNLPGWGIKESRISFIEIALGRRHRILNEIELDGRPRQVAWSVARACEDYPELTESGLVPFCALLNTIPREFGCRPDRDREINELRILLHCVFPEN
nr:trypsin-like peptidase domain-containing protein [Marichromatium gracile]